MLRMIQCCVQLLPLLIWKGKLGFGKITSKSYSWNFPENNVHLLSVISNPNEPPEIMISTRGGSGNLEIMWDRCIGQALRFPGKSFLKPLPKKDPPPLIVNNPHRIRGVSLNTGRGALLVNPCKPSSSSLYNPL